VSKVDVVAGTLGFAAYVLKGPAQDAMVALGLRPEAHPLAVEMRTVNFLRDLELDPAPILGDKVVEAVDRAQAFPIQRIYRRTFREALAFVVPGAMRSQRVFATK
jgi:hypothetical protein